MKSQRGGFGLGLIVGLLVGLALALGVALYIAKVPVPFLDKVGHRSAEQDAAEAEKTKNWDPNASLASKPVVPMAAASDGASDVVATRPGPAASDAAALPGLVLPGPARPPTTAQNPAAGAQAETPSARDPAAILAGQATPGPSPFIYFVQAGAYSRPDDAEQLRAKLALEGLAAKVTERQQSGRTVHRVRLGPFDTKEEAESNQERLKATGAEAVLVRVERPQP
jgi:cell division protein FtsN